MRVLIHKEIKLDPLDEDDIKTLKSSSVFVRVNADSCTILEQKIDLFEENMEKVLDIIHFNSDLKIELIRYETGRYTLKQCGVMC